MVFSEKLIERYRALKAEAPGCLLLMQVGAFMQVMDEAGDPDRGLRPALCTWAADPALAVARVHRSRRAMLARRLWAGSAPVAWIAETGRRVGRVAERGLIGFWGARGTGPAGNARCARVVAV